MGGIAPGGDNWFGLTLPSFFVFIYLGFLAMTIIAGWLMWRDHERRRQVYRYEFKDETLDRAKSVPPLHHGESSK